MRTSGASGVRSLRCGTSTSPLLSAASAATTVASQAPRMTVGARGDARPEARARLPAWSMPSAQRRLGRECGGGGQRPVLCGQGALHYVEASEAGQGSHAPIHRGADLGQALAREELS